MSKFLNLFAKGLKQTAIGCGTIIAIIVVIAIVLNLGDNSEKETKKEDKETTAELSDIDKIKLLFNYPDLGTKWTKDSTMCNEAPKTIRQGLSDRYYCYSPINFEDDIRPPLFLAESEFTFFNDIFNGVYIYLVDSKKLNTRNKVIFNDKKDAIKLLNDIYGEDNIKNFEEYEQVLTSRVSIAKKSNISVTAISYGCKAYSYNSPKGDANFGTRDYDGWGNILNELYTNNIIYPHKIDVVGSWEIFVDDAKNIDRCVVANVTEENIKSDTLGEEPEKIISISAIEVNSEFPEIKRKNNIWQ